uniref:Lipocalin n=1 Tax=Rhipicephalus appendiculatus TaxID=34631 RepID=A0A131Z0C7_RHIAP
MQTDVLVAILVVISTDITTHTAGRDVKQFVSTLQKIWTVKTTNRAFMQCEVDQLRSAAALSIVFERSYLIGGRRRDVLLQGVFDRRHKKRMTLFNRDTFTSTETMVFMDPDRSCAIFKVESLRDWGAFYYDLRVTNSSITSRPRPSCPHFFNRLVGFEPSFTVYTPNCQGIIRGEQ